LRRGARFDFEVHSGRVAKRNAKRCWPKGGKRSGFRTGRIELYLRTGGGIGRGGREERISNLKLRPGAKTKEKSARDALRLRSAQAGATKSEGKGESAVGMCALVDRRALEGRSADWLRGWGRLQRRIRSDTPFLTCRGRRGRSGLLIFEFEAGLVFLQEGA